MSNNTFAKDVDAGLSARKKQLPSKYFYDDEGSRLFQQIMELPEYYLTRAEMNIMQTRTLDIYTSIDSKKLDNNDSLFSMFSNQKIRFLVVGSNWSDENKIRALVAGAAGYCGEGEPSELLVHAVECILKGDTWIQRHLVPKVIGKLMAMKAHSTQDDVSVESLGRLKLLSGREREVAGMVREGKNNKRIALILNISERTVKAHLTSIFRKLNISDRLQLALFIKEID